MINNEWESDELSDQIFDGVEDFYEHSSLVSYEKTKEMEILELKFPVYEYRSHWFKGNEKRINGYKNRKYILSGSDWYTYPDLEMVLDKSVLLVAYRKIKIARLKNKLEQIK